MFVPVPYSYWHRCIGFCGKITVSDTLFRANKIAIMRIMCSDALSRSTDGGKHVLLSRVDFLRQRQLYNSWIKSSAHLGGLERISSPDRGVTGDRSRRLCSPQRVLVSLAGFKLADLLLLTQESPQCAAYAG